MKKLQKITNKFAKLFFVSLLIFNFISSYDDVKAATYGVILEVNGGEDISIFNGEQVDLSWFINAPSGNLITNCSITLDGNVVHSGIDTTVLPASGTITITPPNNASSNYLLKCDQEESSQVIVNTNLPTINMTITEGSDVNTAPQVNTLQFNAITGRVKGKTSDNGIVYVKWSSTNANKCSVLKKEFSSNIGVLYSETSVTSEYVGFEATSGYVRYDGSPRSITGTTTFYITCYNDDIGASVTASTTIYVTAPTTPPPINVNLYVPPLPGGSTTVKQDLVYGYALVNINLTSQNATQCTQTAYYADGTKYTTNPKGWGGGYTSRNFTNIKIATTTDFTVICSRATTTFNGVVYNATSSKKNLRINVEKPDGIGSGVWDRSTLPSVKINITASVNPVYKDSINGQAHVYVSFGRSGEVDYCNVKTYKINNTPNDYLDDVEVDILSAGYKIFNGNGTTTVYTALNESIRFSLYCAREYDEIFGNLIEKDNGTETDNIIIEVLEPIVTIPAPTVNFYASNINYFFYDFEYEAIEMLGFENIDWDNGPFTFRAAEGSLFNSVTLKPNLGNDVTKGLFNIDLSYCDENDGVATYRVKINDVLVSEIISDSNSSVTNACQGMMNYGYVNKKIIDNYPINNGDEIKIECERSASSGESCDINNLSMYSNNVVTTQVNPLVKFASTRLMWGGSNIGYCNNFLAKTLNKPDTSWYNYNHAAGNQLLQVSSSTNFSLECGRYGDSQKASANVSVIVPFKSDLSAEVAVNVGECKSDGTFSGYNLGDVINPVPKGYSPDSNGYCKKQLDLEPAIISLGYSLPSVEVDNERGLYKNVPIRFIIDSINVGGVLPEGEKVSYYFTIDFDPALGKEPVTSGNYDYDDGIELVTDIKKSTGLLSALLEDIDIPFGKHNVCIHLNKIGDVYPESNLDNNTKCLEVDVPPPTPPMSIKFNNTSDNLLIRKYQTVSVDWEVKVEYVLNCKFAGVGIEEVGVFDPSDDYPDPYTQSVSVNSIKNKSEYLLQCTEPITNTVFNKKAWIEVVPSYMNM